MKRILAVKLSSLGDLFHALPAVALIREGLGVDIDWACHDAYAGLVRCFEPVSRVLAFPRHSWRRDGPAFLKELRAERYDLALDLQGLLKSALVARAARSRCVVGPSFHREGACLFYDDVVGQRNRDRHAIDECLDAARYLSVPDRPVRFPIRIPDYRLDAPRPRVGILARSRREEKNWPIPRFAEVARALQERARATVILLGSEADRADVAALKAELGDCAIDLCGRTSLTELLGLLKQLDLLVTVDSGPMHMAAAVGTPVVAVFGPTDPVRVGPYGEGHCVIRQGDDIRQLPAAPVVEAAIARCLRTGSSSDTATRTN